MKTFCAVIFGIGVLAVLSFIPFLEFIATPIAILAGISAGIYLMSRND